MRSALVVASVAAVFLVIGCGGTPPATSCTQDSDCPGGSICVNGVYPDVLERAAVSRRAGVQ